MYLDGDWYSCHTSVVPLQPIGRREQEGKERIRERERDQREREIEQE